MQSVAAVLELGVIAGWIWQHVEMGRLRRDGLKVEPADPLPELPSMAVIIPARNEESRIGACLESVLSQDVPDLRVVVADDRSEDCTQKVVNAVISRDPRVSLVKIDRLPPGWLGKSHALWHAAQRADAEWLLFIDADCRLLPGGIPAALSFAIRGRLDFLSLWPRDGSVGFWERLLIPLCGAMIVIWYGGRRVNDARSPDAFANGQFILTRRSAYLACGGHEAVKSALIEDVPLARRIKAGGFSVLSALGVHIYSVRMYDSLGEIISGWQRIYVGVLTATQIFLSVMSILVGSLLPFFVLPLALFAIERSSGKWGYVWAALAGVHLVALLTTSLRFFSLARCRLRYLWLYPLSCLGVTFILVSALWNSCGRSTVSWRGTKYEVRKSTIRT